MASHIQSTCFELRSLVRSLVQLKVREPEMAEGAPVQDLSMLASARQPRGDRGLTVAEDPLGGGRVQPFGQRREHPCDLMRRGFQTV